MRVPPGLWPEAGLHGGGRANAQRAAAWAVLSTSAGRPDRRISGAGLGGDGGVGFGAAVSVEGEDGGAAKLALLEVAVGNDEFVIPGGGLGDDFALRVDDDGVAEKFVAVFGAGFGDGDGEGGVLIGAGLDGEMGVEDPQMGRFKAGGGLVERGGVVAEHDEFDALQAEDAP